MQIRGMQIRGTLVLIMEMQIRGTRVLIMEARVSPLSASTTIVSRDRHLLNLMDESRADGADFIQKFPKLAIVMPEALIQQISLGKRR
jgi:hypothetical protein